MKREGAPGNVSTKLPHVSRTPFIFSFPRSCVGMHPGTLRRPACNAGALQPCAPTEDRGSEQAKEIVSGEAFNLRFSETDQAVLGDSKRLKSSLGSVQVLLPVFLLFSFPRSCVAMYPGTLLRPTCNAGSLQPCAPTEDRGSEQGEEVISGQALSSTLSITYPKTSVSVILYLFQDLKRAC